MATRTIRTNLLWIVFAALLPLIGIAVWQGNLALEDSRELVASRLRANAWGIAESERDPFIIAEHSLTFAAQSPEVRSMGRGCSAVLANAIQGASGITNFGRTDASGRIRCSVLPFTPGEDLSNSPWWRKRAGRTTLYLAEPEVGTISKQPIHIMVLPLVSVGGEFDGTLSAGISIKELSQSLRVRQAELPGAIYVVDRTGQPLIAAGPGSIARFDLATDQARTLPHQIAAKDGAQWIYVMAPLYRDQLFVVYAEPQNLVTRSAMRRMWPNLVLPLLALLLTSVAIWIATQRLILRWLTQLQHLTARFARGDFRGELEAYAGAPAELREFAYDLHEMAAAIDAKERDLRDALTVKTLLTKEVNHRVKNNLQIVNSLLTLQAERMTDPAAKLALGQARARIAALGLLHRLMYEEDHGGQGRVDMQRLLNELSSQLRNTHRERTEISIVCEADPLVLSADRAVPLTLFAVETIVNAFQHAFAIGSEGQIRVTLRRDGENAILCVEDNGHGFVPAAVGQNMGSVLIQAFAQQVGGTVAIDSPPSGTSVTLTLPLETEGSADYS